MYYKSLNYKVALWFMFMVTCVVDVLLLSKTMVESKSGGPSSLVLTVTKLPLVSVSVNVIGKAGKVIVE